jgi:hypothetical protein
MKIKLAQNVKKSILKQTQKNTFKKKAEPCECSAGSATTARSRTDILSEYVSWYRKRPEEIQDIALGSWINGETGGYLRVCTEGRNWFDTDFPNWMKDPALHYAAEERSHEHGSYIIEELKPTGYTGAILIP